MNRTSSLRALLLALPGLALLLLLVGCGGGSGGYPSNITLVNPMEDPLKPGSIGGTASTLEPGPVKPEAILDQAFGATIVLDGITDTGASYTNTTTSINRGGFVFSDVPAGTYTLTASVQAPYGSPTTLTGVMGGVRVRGNIPTLMANVLLFDDARGATVRGTVYENGHPVGDAAVSMEVQGYPVEYINNDLVKPVYTNLTTTTSTQPDTLGQYEFRVPADCVGYFISAQTADSYASEIDLLNLQNLDFGGTVTGGTFTLSITNIGVGTSTTSALAYNISNANLKIAIDELLTAAGYNGVTVTIGGGPCPTDATVTFGGTVGNYNMPLMVVTSVLTGTAPTLTVRILQPGEVRENQNITLSPSAQSIFPRLFVDIVTSTLPAPTPQASEQAMITRLAVARGLRAPRGCLERLEEMARQARATRTTATGLIENDLYWSTPDDVLYISGFHAYRGLQASGQFTYMGSAQNPLQWYFFDNDPALPLDTACFYTILSYGANGQISQPSLPVTVALPLPQINVIAPDDGTVLPAAASVQFSWDAVPNAKSYVFTIYSTKPTYNATPVYEGIVNGMSTSYWLNAGSEYWWSVSAYSDEEPNWAKSISYSAYRTVTVQ